MLFFTHCTVTNICGVLIVAEKERFRTHACGIVPPNPFFTSSHAMAEFPQAEICGVLHHFLFYETTRVSPLGDTLVVWRRRRDSNSRTVLPVTRFPIVRPRPTRRLLQNCYPHIISQTKNKINTFFNFSLRYFSGMRIIRIPV